MDIRYSCNQKDFKRYTTEEMRDEMLITGLYKADEVVAVYSHVDRMVTLGCMPVHETVSIDKGIDVWANFGTHYFLERREIGMFNIGKDSTGIVVADGVKYELGYKDCLYITQGTKEVTFASADPEHPAKFYMVSAPAHCAYDIYYMRPFSIMVRFPGRFFETHVAKMSNINQIILVISSVILVCISVTIWKRRRVH